MPTNYTLTIPSSAQDAVRLQNELRDQVETLNRFNPAEVKRIAGIDASYKDDGRAAVVVLSFPQLEVVERVTATLPLTFPYIPGLLSFRETPVVLAALNQLQSTPDLLLLDGQGIAHPRRFGIACHVGLITGIPAIGVAKSILVGTHAPLDDAVGSMAPLLHKGESVAMALRSRARSNPLIISAGHKIDLPTSVEFVVRCLRGYRLPEPTRLAHNAAGEGEAVIPVGAEPPDSHIPAPLTLEI